jgi:hypothetical protein
VIVTNSTLTLLTPSPPPPPTLSAFALGIAFSHISRSTSLPKKCTLPLLENILRNPFPALLLLHFLFNKPMPITYFEGIKRPCNFTGTRSLVLQKKGKWMMISDNRL